MSDKNLLFDSTDRAPQSPTLDDFEGVEPLSQGHELSDTIDGSILVSEKGSDIYADVDSQAIQIDFPSHIYKIARKDFQELLIRHGIDPMKPIGEDLSMVVKVIFGKLSDNEIESWRRTYQENLNPERHKYIDIPAKDAASARVLTDRITNMGMVDFLKTLEQHEQMFTPYISDLLDLIPLDQLDKNLIHINPDNNSEMRKLWYKKIANAYIEGTTYKQYTWRGIVRKMNKIGGKQSVDFLKHRWESNSIGNARKRAENVKNNAKRNWGIVVHANMVVPMQRAKNFFRFRFGILF